MKRLLFIFSILYFIQTDAQDLTGIWRGTFTSDGATLNGYEVQINNVGKMASGVTYSYGGGTEKFYLKFSLVGMWNPTVKKILFQEEKLLEHSGTSLAGVENFTCYLFYNKVGNKEILEGDYNSLHYKTTSTGRFEGKIHLEKVLNSYFGKEDFIVKKEKEIARQINEAKQEKAKITPLERKETPVKPNITANLKTVLKPEKTSLVKQKPVVSPSQNPTSSYNQTPLNPEVPKVETPPTSFDLPKVLTERKNELVKTILVSTDEIQVDFYDNGEIDGDTISIYSNGKQIGSHRGLSTIPVSFKIKFDKENPDQEIIMVAENLGTIPPNTALMIVKVGTKRYDVNMSSSEQKNAMVRFRYQKEE